MNKLLFISLLLLGTNSLAATWEKVGENSASAYYFDSDSFAEVNFKGENIIKAWEKVVVKKPVVNKYKINDVVPESAIEATFNSVCATYQINTVTHSYMKINGE